MVGGARCRSSDLWAGGGMMPDLFAEAANERVSAARAVLEKVGASV